MRNRKLVQWFLPLLLVAVSFAAYQYFTFRAERQALDEITLRANRSLSVQADAILTQLDKYRYLPSIIAKSGDISNMPTLVDDTNWTEINRFIKKIAANSGALDIALALPSGKIVTAATGFVNTAMVENTELRIAPGQGRLGRASISVVNGQRAYAFSSGIGFGPDYQGFVVVVASIEGIERAWALAGKPLFATNFADQIVARNFQAEELADIIGAGNLEPAKTDIVVSSRGETYKVFTQNILVTGWKLHVLEQLKPVRQASQLAGTISVLGSALTGLILMIMIWRLQQRLIRERLEKANSLRLERKVAERTRELSTSNKLLEGEIAERRNAENALIEAQKDLIQAEKLAAIGKISATLAHEYNQPLAAIRTYSENAETYLARGAGNKVRENLALISGLVDRLAMLSKTLLSFSRKDQPGGAMVVLGEAVRDAIILTAFKAEKENIAIICDTRKMDFQVVGDRLRLGQVFVNLINNAIDASADAVTREIVIDAHAGGKKHVIATVRDYGSGIDREISEKLFEPFFTTKDVGRGLGLGLSIVSNTLKDVGATLAVQNAEGGGAEFTITFLKSEATDQPKHHGNRKPCGAQSREHQKAMTK